MDKKEIIKIVDFINNLMETCDKSNFNHEAINWGDLSVVEISQNFIYYPEEYVDVFHIIIEEVSPDALDFCEFIGNAVYEKFEIMVWVVGEW